MADKKKKAEKSSKASGESEAPETPAPETPTPETPAAEAGTPETPQASVEGPAAEAGEQAAPEHAVPTEQASEIAAVVEDAPLEALQEAAERPAKGADKPAEVTGEPRTGQAVPTGEAAEIASVVEDAPLEALQEAEEPAGQEQAGAQADAGEDEEKPAPRVKPSVPGAHLEVDIVPEGVDPLGRDRDYVDPYAIEDEIEQDEGADGEGLDGEGQQEEEEVLTEPIATAAIDLAAGARYRATGKRKTAIARVTLRPGKGTYLINGRVLEEHFPRVTLQRNIRQPLETVGYQERMDVVARLHGGGISAQAGALRHGVSRALLEADPNLRGELKRRGFLTRDSRAKERKKAGLKKARKRPQFSKR
jgi:small subunit ribosomal protein S9